MPRVSVSGRRFAGDSDMGVKVVTGVRGGAGAEEMDRLVRWVVLESSWGMAGKMREELARVILFAVRRCDWTGAGTGQRQSPSVCGAVRAGIVCDSDATVATLHGVVGAGQMGQWDSDGTDTIAG